MVFLEIGPWKHNAVVACLAAVNVAIMFYLSYEVR
jgi:hypothetical protein